MHHRPHVKLVTLASVAKSLQGYRQLAAEPICESKAHLRRLGPSYAELHQPAGANLRAGLRAEQSVEGHTVEALDAGARQQTWGWWHSLGESAVGAVGAGPHTDSRHPRSQARVFSRCTHAAVSEPQDQRQVPSCCIKREDEYAEGHAEGDS